MKKKKAKFWVDWLLEAGEANVCHRYWFEIELEDGFYEGICNSLCTSMFWFKR